jgi:hypothetical protein
MGNSNGRIHVRCSNQVAEKQRLVAVARSEEKDEKKADRLCGRIEETFAGLLHLAVYRSTETGPEVVAVVLQTPAEDDFWFNSFTTPKQAWRYVKDMGLAVDEKSMYFFRQTGCTK